MAFSVLAFARAARGGAPGLAGVAARCARPLASSASSSAAGSSASALFRTPPALRSVLGSTLFRPQQYAPPSLRHKAMALAGSNSRALNMGRPLLKPRLAPPAGVRSAAGPTLARLQAVVAAAARGYARAAAGARRMSSGAGGSGSGGAVAWYNGLLEKSPILTKVVTSAVIVLLGDLGCQVFVEGGDIDLPRLARMFFLGGALVAPVLHVWYGALYRWFPAPTVAGVLTRVALDQLVFAPAFCALFFSAIFGLEGRLDQLEDHMRANYLGAVKVNWIMWIPAQIINFRFVPPQLQVLFANFVALFWNTYLSWVGHKDQHSDGDAAAIVDGGEPPAAPAAPAATA